MSFLTFLPARYLSEAVFPPLNDWLIDVKAFMNKTDLIAAVYIIHLGLRAKLHIVRSHIVVSLNFCILSDFTTNVTGLLLSC